MLPLLAFVLSDLAVSAFRLQETEINNKLGFSFSPRGAFKRKQGCITKHVSIQSNTRF